MPRDFFASQVAQLQEYFVYFNAVLRWIAKKDPAFDAKRFSEVARNKSIALQTRLGAMRHKGISFMHLFLRRY
jgi:hypothetical protein